MEISRLNKIAKIRLVALLGFVMSLGFITNPVLANGDIGEHVNHLQDNIENYTKEINWLIGEVDKIVEVYDKGDKRLVKPERLIELWESVDFHAAIESNYVPIYASIWQGLYGIKQGLENRIPITKLSEEQENLERALWQALGAVKLAAQFQEKGLLSEVQTREANPQTPSETIVVINKKLDRVVAKAAEKLAKEATDIVHNTYLSLFEGIEGGLIALDAKLVEDLEKDFNVTLPQAINENQSVDDVRQTVEMMKEKLARAKRLLENAQKNKKEVF